MIHAIQPTTGKGKEKSIEVPLDPLLRNPLGTFSATGSPLLDLPTDGMAYRDSMASIAVNDEDAIRHALLGINTSVQLGLEDVNVHDLDTLATTHWDDDDDRSSKGLPSFSPGVVVLQSSREGSYDHYPMQTEGNTRGRPKGVKDRPGVDKEKRGRPKGAKNAKGTIVERRQRDLELGIPPPVVEKKKRFVRVSSSSVAGCARRYAWSEANTSPRRPEMTEVVQLVLKIVIQRAQRRMIMWTGQVQRNKRQRRSSTSGSPGSRKIR